MLYEAYKNKLEKRKRRFERFWRFRLLFLLIFLMLLAAAGAMMGVAGQVTAVSVPQTKFFYGQPLSMQASSVFGGAGFEFRLKGTEVWSEKEPRAAGTYECRAVGKSIVGTSRPSGEVFSFTIDPMETVVSVADSSIVYGNTPSFTANLCYDDVLQVNDYTKVEKSGDIVNIEADLAAVKILSADGEDVTGSYDVKTVARDVTEIARKLTVTTASETYEYDGKPHSAEEIILEGDGLAEGHRIEEEGTIFASLTDVGEIQNCPERDGHFHILDENGNDVTGKYKVTRKYGTLKVTPRELTVTTQGDEFTYDGKEHEYGDLTPEGLAEGQKAVRSDTVCATDAKDYENKPEYVIQDADGNTISKNNYKITEEIGTITVNKRPLTVRTQDGGFTYDGTAHEYGDLTAVGLADGQKAVRNGSLLAQNAGTHENKSDYVIQDESDEHEISKNNYEITEEFGTVTVAKRELTLSTESYEIPYDGTEHTYNDLAADGLAGEQTITRTDTLRVQNAKEYPNEPQFTIQDGETPISAENYEIIEHYGTVTVTKLAIKVETHSAEFVYDGIEHRYGVEEEAYDLEGTLAAGQELKFFDVLVMKDAGERSNEPDIRVYDGEDDVSANYDIDKVYGKVHILQRVVEVTTNSQSFPYDGQAHTELGFEILPAQEGRYLPVEGHTLVPSAVASITNYSDTPVSNELAFTVSDGTPSRNRDATDNLTGNYIIRIVTYGELTVQKREVTIHAASDDTLIYNGEGQTVARFEECSDLVEGHYAVGTFTAFLEAKTYDNIPTETHIFDANGDDVTNNYIVTVTAGKVTIHKREVTLTTGSDTVTYDAKAHGESTYSALSELDLVEGHKVEAVFQTWINANEAGYENALKAVKIRDADGNDVTDNYKLNWQWGRVVINKRHVTVTSDSQTGSESWVYDGQEHSKNTFHVEETNGDRGLAEGHTYKADTRAPFFTNVNETRDQTENNVLQYSDEFIGLATDAASGSNNCKDNYIIEHVSGTVTIKKRPLHVTTKSETFTYNGVLHTYDEKTLEYTDPEGTEAGLLVNLGHTIRFDGGEYAFTNANESGYVNNPTIRIEVNGDNNVMDNYELTVNKGKVTILKRLITVTTKLETFTYDGKDHEYSDIYAEPTNEDRGLAPDQQIRRLDTKTWRSAGKYTNAPKDGNTRTYEIYDGTGETTENYEITEVFGTVIINKRPIHVTTKTETFTYDGILHKYLEDTLTIVNKDVQDAGLAENQELLINKEAQNSYYAFKEASENPYTNHPILYISDGKDDVSSNYKWEYGEDDYGTITINKRPITISSKSKEFVYDDTEHSFWGADAYTYTENGKDVGLALNQNLVVTGGTTLIEVDEKDNVLIYHISDENGDNVTDNYEIHDEYGTITVTKRKVKILTGSQSYVYDATSHSMANYTSWNWGKGWGTEEGNPYYKLVDGHTLSATYPSITNVWETEEENNKLDINSVRILKDGRNVIGNYDITWEWGTITITPRPVNVTTGSENHVYDAKPFSVEAYSAEAFTTESGGRGIVLGHKITADNYASVTNVWDNKDTNNVWTGHHIYEGEPGEGKTDLIRNYTIYWTYGTIAITPRPVTITADGGTHVYDDKDFSVNTYVVEEFDEGNHTGLVTGHKFTAKITAPILHDVDRKSNELRYEDISVMAGSDNVTQNYAFADYYVYKTIEVTPRHATITTPGGTHVYDGTEFSVQEYDVEKFEGDRGLVTGHEFSAENITYPVITTVQDLENKVELGNITIAAADGRSIDTRNYVFEYEYGMLHVTKRPVTITTLGDSFVYDGQGHSVEKYTAEEFEKDGGRGLLAGHILSANYPTYTNVWDTADGNNTVSSVRILGNVNGGEGADDLTENYEITWVNGTITITPRPVNVTTGSESFVYDGQSHSVMGYTAEEFDADGKRGLVDGHKITAETYASFINFMETKDIDYNNEWKGEYHIYHGEPGAGEDLIRNYDITWTWGTITITKRPVLITSQGGTWGYDGQPHSADFDYERADGNGDRGVLSGHSLTVLGKEVTDITDTLDEYGKYKFGAVENAFDDGDVKIVLTTYDGVSVKENYEIEKGDLGRLRIQSAIYVFLYTHNKQYDGKPLSYDPSQQNYRIITVPAGAENWKYTITLGGTIEGIDSLTAAQVLTQSTCTVRDAAGNDITKQNRFVFVSGNPKEPREDATVLNVTQRKLTIHTINMKVSRTDEGSDVERNYFVNGSDQSLYYLTVNTLLEGHHLQCIMTGQLLLAQVSAKNTLLKKNVKVLDSNENGVTEYYDITIEEGTITWLNEPTTATGGATSPQSEALPPDNKQ